MRQWVSECGWKRVSKLIWTNLCLIRTNEQMRVSGYNSPYPLSNKEQTVIIHVIILNKHHTSLFRASSPCCHENLFVCCHHRSRFAFPLMFSHLIIITYNVTPQKVYFLVDEIFNLNCQRHENFQYHDISKISGNCGHSSETSAKLLKFFVSLDNYYFINSTRFIANEIWSDVKNEILVKFIKEKFFVPDLSTT